jgi:hypothetical protein
MVQIFKECVPLHPYIHIVPLNMAKDIQKVQQTSVHLAYYNAQRMYVGAFTIDTPAKMLMLHLNLIH